MTAKRPLSADGELNCSFCPLRGVKRSHGREAGSNSAQCLEIFIISLQENNIKHVSQNMVVTDPKNTTRDTARDGETPAPWECLCCTVGGDAGCQETSSTFSKPPSRDRAARRAGLAQNWKCHTPREVTAQKGSCAQIPCHYSYPSHLANQTRVGIWFHNKKQDATSIAFHSENHSQVLPRFRQRTWLSGNLKNGDCSLMINNIKGRDAGSYYFRVEFSGSNKYKYLPVTQLHVSNFMDKPTIAPVEIIAGKRMNLNCTFNTTCTGTAPALTWDTPTAVHGSVSYTVTQHGATLTYTSVLALTPSLRDQGQTLTCRLSYPTVSSEQTLVMTVRYPPQEITVSTSAASGGIREGNNVTLTCSSESVPSISHYTWFRIEGNASTQLNTNSQILSFTPVTRGDDAGFYCTATNPLGNSSSNTTHLNVEYGPEISQVLGCAQRSEGTTCVCVANSNPPGELTWHLPHANLSGNQTHRGFVSQQLRAGHQVMGFLILMGHQDEEEVMATCSVRNPHGVAMFKSYLWLKERDCNEWAVGLVSAGIMLTAFLAGIFILQCAQNRRKTAAEEAAAKTNENAPTDRQLSVRHQGLQENMMVTDP
ncbi:sialic acid-binding Ig-like lectin 5 [Stegostoma tigrinum]|uniref:sialic acid-binding Ig-like lectin 5 n=1 Tax=Stegostoma tigrinum TaxID=3053191 RepID=UPI002870280F|nr:sialic acid-binding Ig-like lectin 5 [Stegostoma tigrinum]